MQRVACTNYDYLECKYFTRQSLEEAPRCKHEQCWFRYYKEHPYRLLIVKQAIEQDRQKTINTFGVRYVKNAERIIRDLDNNRAA